MCEASGGAIVRQLEGSIDTAHRRLVLSLEAPDAHWQILLAALSDEGAVREVAPGRIEVHGPEGAVVTVVVTPGQWEQVLADHVGGDVDLYFAELLGPRQDDETFLVFYNGNLSRSIREKLPPVRGRALERGGAGRTSPRASRVARVSGQPHRV